MSPAARRVAIIAAGAAVLVLAFLLLRGGDDSTDKTTATTTTAAPSATPPATSTEDDGAAPAATTVRVVGGKPQGGVQKLSFKKGETVAFQVVSDTADEIHVHGYDLHKDVAEGGSASFSFPAKIDGRFEVELEDSAVEIAQLDVVP